MQRGRPNKLVRRAFHPVVPSRLTLGVGSWNLGVD
jgi:hypothetical protein